jgi:hypothetical protein
MEFCQNNVKAKVERSTMDSFTNPANSSHNTEGNWHVKLHRVKGQVYLLGTRLIQRPSDATATREKEVERIESNVAHAVVTAA